MAIVSYPVYNNGEWAAPVCTRGFSVIAPWIPIVIRRDERLKRDMTIALPISTRVGDGVRPVDMARDLPQVIDLLKMVFGDALESDEQQLFGNSSPVSANGLMYRFNPAAARLSNGFVWQSDGRIIGNATLLTTRSWDRYLVANVAVNPAYRRRGIARALMGSITESVKERGGRVILLQVVKDNQSAINLYNSLGYRSIGNMTTWYASPSRLRELSPDPSEEQAPSIELLPGNRWRDAYQLDTAHVHADLNWPEPILPDAYKRTLLRRAADFLNGRQSETWVVNDTNNRLIGLASILGEWGRSYQLVLRVHPDWSGQLERPLLAKAIRRLRYLPRRNVRIDHPEADGLTTKLLQESNFSVQRTLTHMRLDVTR